MLFSRGILLLFCGALCNAKSIMPKSWIPKTFLTQGEDRQETVDDATLSYLNHGYYNIAYSPLTDWNKTDISQTGETSKMTNTDDPPPFEVIYIQSKGWVFPFYGHAHPVIYIDSNGFVSMVPRYCPHYGFCNWREPEGHHDSEYQRYIAPMMTDFNPSRFNDSTVTYQFDTVNGQPQLTIQWTNIVLFSFSNPSMETVHDGFTFQIILQKSGDIIFNYRKLPYYPGNRTLRSVGFPSKKYPTIMGLEDAVIVKRGDKNVLADYKPLNLDENKIFEMMAKYGGVTVTHRALPTCPEFKSCYDCVNYTINNGGILKCGWCEADKICADIMGRESSSLSAGCLANNQMLGTFQQCDNIGKVVEEPEVDQTFLFIAIAVIIVILLCLICLLFRMKKMKGQLAEYSKGIPQDAESANRAKSIPGMRNNSGDDKKIEISA